MSENKFKILALDLDGTLLDSQKRISPTNFNAIVELQRQGVIVVLASGRPTYGVAPIARELRLDEFGGYMLSYNGGKITACGSGQILSRNTIDLSFMEPLYRLAKECGVEILTYTRDQIITETPESRMSHFESRINYDMPIHGVESFVDAITAPVFKVSFLGEPDAVDYFEPLLRNTLGDALHIFRSEGHFVEVVPRYVDKGKALRFLLEELKLPMDELVAVGDSYNDLGMIDAAGLGVAMGNANESIKRTAKYVTKSNDEDGVAHLINKYFLERFTPEEVDLSALNAMTRNTLMESLGIICTHLSEGRVECTMPVDRRTRQPMGILHGGASLALAETAAGYGTIFLLEENEIQVGMQVSGNHVSSAHEGDVVKAVGTILHHGRSTHVWNIDISTETGKLVSSIRVINSILRRR